MDPRAGFIASAVEAGFTEKQAEWMWTAIPFHPLVEEWKRDDVGRDLNDKLAHAANEKYMNGIKRFAEVTGRNPSILESHMSPLCRL